MVPDADDPAPLAPEVYAELRRLAARCLRRERRAHTLEATALVHEAFLHLSGGGSSSRTGPISSVSRPVPCATS